MSRTDITIADKKLFLEEATGVLTEADGTIVDADVQRISKGEYSILIGGRSFHLFLTRTDAMASATMNNFVFEVKRETLRDVLTRKLQKDAGAQNGIITVRAPMPGLITKILKTEGSSVLQGDGILVIEAMKMENEIKAPRSGIITRIHTAERRTTEKNDHLFTIESL